VAKNTSNAAAGSSSPDVEIENRNKVHIDWPLNHPLMLCSARFGGVGCRLLLRAGSPTFFRNYMWPQTFTMTVGDAYVENVSLKSHPRVNDAGQSFWR
jgi:hypothetical protein